MTADLASKSRLPGVMVASCLAGAAVFYFTIERPFLKLRDRREGRRGVSVDAEARTEPAL